MQEYSDLNYRLDVTDIGNKIYDSSDLYNHIEYILKEIIECIMKFTLKDINIEYIILGGKAINNIINDRLEKSFDFDIHIIEEDSVDNFGNLLAKNMNSFINSNLLYKYFIYKILLDNKLITDGQEFIEHYIKNKALFSYGCRIKKIRSSESEIRIYGIFFHFYFIESLFVDEKYSNKIDAELLGNHIFYPISDIVLDKELTFGGINSDEYKHTNEYDSLNYANYALVLYNLFNYINKGGYKIIKNIKKRYFFTDIENYSCSFLNNYTNIDHILNIMKQINDIKDENDSHLNGPILNVKYELSCISAILQSSAKGMLLMCDRNIIIKNNKNINIKETIFIDSVSDSDIGGIENLVHKNDNLRLLLLNTSNETFNSNVNRWCQLKDKIKNLLIGNNKENYDINITVTLHNNIERKIETTFEYDLSQLELYTGIISNTITSVNEKMNKDIFKDSFYLYRLHNVCTFESASGDIYNTSALKPGIIILVKHFMSTSFSNEFDFSSFLNDNTVLLRIMVDKSSKSWVFLNNYSYYPNEREVLLNKDICLYVKNIEYKTIEDKNNNIKDIKVIDVDLYDKYKDMFLNYVEFKNNNIKAIDMDLSDEESERDIESNASDIALSDEESERDIESNASDIALSDEESEKEWRASDNESDDVLLGGHLSKLKGKNLYNKAHSPKPFQNKNLINNTTKIYKLKPLRNKGMQFNENKTLQYNKVSKFSKSKIAYITKDTPLFNFDNHPNNMGFIYDLSCEKRGTTFNDDMNLYMKIYKQICKSTALNSNNEKICIN